MAGERLKSTIAVLMIGTVAAQAAESAFCKPGEGANGSIKLNFQVQPSLVVADGTLDVTFEMAGMSSNPTGGSRAESLFSFARTIDAILVTAGAMQQDAPVDERQAKKIDFVRTMIESFDNDKELMLNPQSAVLMPVEDRFVSNGDIGAGEGKIDPSRMLDASDTEFGMRPLALFNRFDLAPENWSNCGEYRIVYGKPNGGFQNRLTLIFEASIPNPGFKAGLGAAGCKGVIEHWARLNSGTNPDALISRAKALSEFYYDGLASVTDIPETPGLDPVVSFRNYGGDGRRGQVRGNLFVDNPWQLREWLTQIVVSDGTAKLSFVPETVKNNPAVELYADNASVTSLGQKNLPIIINRLQGDFFEQFATVMQNNLFVERQKKFSDLRDGLTKIDAGVTEDNLTITLLGLGSHGRFDEFQSVSDDSAGTEDRPTMVAGPQLRNMLEFLAGRPETTVQGGAVSQQSVNVILSRAEAGTCAGCHQTAVGTVIKNRVSGDPLLWPGMIRNTPGFVHVDEQRRLSEALLKDFLPVRRYLMGRFLCTETPVPPASFTVASESTGQASHEPYYVARLIAEAADPEITTLSADEDTGPPVALFSAVRPERRAPLIGEIARTIRAERNLEQSLPGAFVERRRPH